MVVSRSLGEEERGWIDAAYGPAFLYILSDANLIVFKLETYPGRRAYVSSGAEARN